MFMQLLCNTSKRSPINGGVPSASILSINSHRLAQVSTGGKGMGRGGKNLALCTEELILLLRISANTELFLQLYEGTIYINAPCTI